MTSGKHEHDHQHKHEHSHTPIPIATNISMATKNTAMNILTSIAMNTGTSTVMNILIPAALTRTIINIRQVRNMAPIATTT